MATTYKFANNAESELVSEIGAADVTLNITTGDGALFPEVAVADGNQFYVLVVDGSTEEWMLCTSRSGDVLTVTRGGSDSFSVGSTVRLKINATILDSFMQKGVYRSNAGSPDGSLVASYTGEEVYDSVNAAWYKHCSSTVWRQITA